MRIGLLATVLGIVSSKIRVGILGLPNVGKSTLFNAIARQSIAQAANFPFCTIEPNVAPIAVPSDHLDGLQALAGTERAVPATIEWVDIAGLAKGASRGEGLGNKFLAKARECDALTHVVRTFDDPDTIHVDGRVDPLADAEVINVELLLADEAHVESQGSQCARTPHCISVHSSHCGVCLTVCGAGAEAARAHHVQGRGARDP